MLRRLLVLEFPWIQVRINRLHPLLFCYLDPILATLKFFQKFIIHAGFLGRWFRLDLAQLRSLRFDLRWLRMFHGRRSKSFITTIGRIAQAVYATLGRQCPLSGGRWFELWGANVGSTGKCWRIALIMRLHFRRSRGTFR